MNDNERVYQVSWALAEHDIRHQVWYGKEDQQWSVVIPPWIAPVNIQRVAQVASALHFTAFLNEDGIQLKPSPMSTDEL